MTRIVSFLPSATEIVCALGRGDHLVGISHECDYPPEARERPVVVRSALELENLSPQAIDDAVRRQLRANGSLYLVDEMLLGSLRPDLILAQDLCQVCAPSGNETTRVLSALSPPPEVLWLTPHTLGEITSDIRSVAHRLGCDESGERLIEEMQSRIARVQEQVRGEPRPRVLFVEWTDPVYCAGHWVPEMIELAGGEDALARAGTDSVRVGWENIAAWAPEVVVIAPCGFRVDAAEQQARTLLAQPGWSALPAVQNGSVYAVDASAYFARPGPRVADGVELLAHLLHPTRASWHGPGDAWRVCV